MTINLKGRLMVIKRIFVEKKEKFNVQARGLTHTFKSILKIENLSSTRVLFRYDIQGLNDDQLRQVIPGILSEANVDDVIFDDLSLKEDERIFGISYLPGQYDQHADSAIQCIQIVSGHQALVRLAKIIILQGDLSEDDFLRIKNYMINPVDSQEVSLDPYQTLADEPSEPQDIDQVSEFNSFDQKGLENFGHQQGFAMTSADLLFVQNYFKNDEKRNPTITELKVIDTYWSDHCRHTTFLTQIKKIEFLGDDPISKAMKKVYDGYCEDRHSLYGPKSDRPLTLMDLATMGTKVLKNQGLLADLDESEEINACSINIVVDHDGVDEDYLLMFKNETHNHPTEIEPFGGAATCLGGAIRDPLSGRSYVYQGMRVSGAGDPRRPIEKTIAGKLPQRKICLEAAQGFSSYGNQIGLATGQVTEVYDPGFLAKRMEVGAVIAAAPKENVIRERPIDGDVILLVGGKTGRDGCGGATGSSKVHTEESIIGCSAEVQKGNPVEERKIQRLFRNPQLSTMIKRCNDFGAGGVSVAIGELADSLTIDLDKVPKKYDGLDGTELAISESQERMAVVVDPANVDAFIKMANEENLDATAVAKVNNSGRLIMIWRGREILNISRTFLDCNGAPQFADLLVEGVKKSEPGLVPRKSFTEELILMLEDLNIASQRGLAEMFDSTVGAASVTMPYGGKKGLSPMDGMIAKIPVEHGDTTTCSMMSFGYNPELAKKSPFIGGMMAVLESLSKITAMGGDYKKVRLSFQEYFESLGHDPIKWGRPFAALLGAYKAQKSMTTPAIGGKDSMSGSFKDLSVPPTLISFAVVTSHIDQVVTSELKEENTTLQCYSYPIDQDGIPDLEQIKGGYETILKEMQSGNIISAKVLGRGGLAEGVVKMALGNDIGVSLNEQLSIADLFSPEDGSILVEVKKEITGFLLVGKSNDQQALIYKDDKIAIQDLAEIWEAPLRDVYPQGAETSGPIETISYKAWPMILATSKFVSPQVFIPIFPGTNCEYDTVKAFKKAGARPITAVFRNQSPEDIRASIDDMAGIIKASQMIVLPGGFSAGDEPNGSGKFIASVFRNPQMNDAVMDLLKNRDGLMLGICNGFQALIKLGLVPNGEICDILPGMPTLTVNTINRHISSIPMTRISSKLSPWLANTEVGEIYRVPMSHGEGRFVASDQVMATLIKNGQIASQYVNFQGEATMDGAFNPNGSAYAVEGITSMDGRILGKMGHSERIGTGLYQNIPGKTDQKIFEAGVEYFK